MFVVYWGLLLASGTICLGSELLSFRFSLLWPLDTWFNLGFLLVNSSLGFIVGLFALSLFFVWVYFLEFLLGTFNVCSRVWSGFSLGSLWDCFRSLLSSLVILAAHFVWVCCSLAFTLGLLA